jgi:hypothetical protein
LVAANLVPLVGVVFLGWDVGLVFIAYWLENGVVGILTVPKILLAGRPDSTATINSRGLAYALAIFFPLHYGIFWAVHGVFVFFLASFATMRQFGMFGAFDPFGNAVNDRSLLLIAAVLMVSHGTSFVVNYVGRKEYLRTTPGAQAIQPYARVIALHVTVILGGFFVVFLGQPVALVALLVIFKTLFDLALHLREHARYRTDPAPAIV